MYLLTLSAFTQKRKKSSSRLPKWIRPPRKPKGASLPIVHPKQVKKVLSELKCIDKNEVDDVICIALVPIRALRKFGAVPKSKVVSALGSNPLEGNIPPMPIKYLQNVNHKYIRENLMWSTNIYESHWQFLQWIQTNRKYDHCFVPCIGYKGWRGAKPDIQLGITGTIESCDNNSPVKCAIRESKEESNLNVFADEVSVSFQNQLFLFEYENRKENRKILETPAYSPHESPQKKRRMR